MTITSNRSRSIKKEFFVDDKENQFIKRQMEKAGIKNFSLFARLMLVTGEVQMIDFPALKKLRLEINKVGVNINQIAKKVNENDHASRSDVQECQEQLEEIRQLVNNLIQSEVREGEKRNGSDQSYSDKVRAIP
ncbi:plasmid mobilization relaxosome protein MobC [Streptococcus cuniculi]|uniref:MobC family plasmid mobilization relaxosome protein n=1 Tax=Streptococcus cuniculi TaxID=1432788 RepID=A0A4Y9JB88_9STRE|nr:plasmid mobilization relaxosome protein MobC [Streptococcus cuniculi]MBF0778910.1 plasmid mobilization relaxosome protein MobC [Streptococcus cuniculi]TFU97184.1 MobC family plasmid mobilization relaxosome protein [Streptococcus cuniculi]